MIADKKFKNIFDAGETEFNIGGFALGFVLLIFGVLVGYFIQNDNEKE